MLKMIITARRNPALTRGEFFAHLRERHWQVLQRYPEPLALLQGYVQNHALGSATPAHLRAPFPVATERDSVIELWFENADALEKLVGMPDYQKHVRPDEAAFNDLAHNIMVRTSAVSCFEAGSVGRCKRFDFLARRAGVAAEAFARMLDEQARGLALDPFYTGHIDRHVHNPVQQEAEGHGFGAGAFDCARELWGASFAALSAVADRTAIAEADPERSFSVYATEFVMRQPPSGSG